ncbi:hypothetical protein PVT67_05215 [Gallaecimonas kandeliae]|uniref:hypothetical protein n=1 Tax=Gallaecimonas kandeliae TaxID=3029055 RepID=UPI0026490A09|nr:hypothetical protein [Gallaecimonas kandeliae]WKE66645.1 hypothetical protein PVT67_05215 [Gallaecimonas kandeliae]
MKPNSRWALPLSCSGNALVVGSTWAYYWYLGEGHPGGLALLLMGALLAGLGTFGSLYLCRPAWARDVKSSAMAGGIIAGFICYLALAMQLVGY